MITRIQRAAPGRRQWLCRHWNPATRFGYNDAHKQEREPLTVVEGRCRCNEALPQLAHRTWALPPQASVEKCGTDEERAPLEAKYLAGRCSRKRGLSRQTEAKPPQTNHCARPPWRSFKKGTRPRNTSGGNREDHRVTVTETPS